VRTHIFISDQELCVIINIARYREFFVKH